MVDLNDDTHTSGGPEAAFANVEPIFDASDLPRPEQGYHDLSKRDGTVYIFVDTVTSGKGLKLGPMTPVLGWHGGISQFVYTGDRAAIKSDGNPVFMDALGVLNMGGGKTFDISANGSTEHLVNECTFIGGDLGVVDGYRVPSFKTCNFEQFTSGLRFTGSSDKILLEGCPLRNIQADGVTLLTFDGGLDTGIVSIDGCFIAGLQSDTKVVDVDPAASITTSFQYRGTTHYNGVVEANILNGAVGIEEPGTNVESSPPLRNSGSGGEYDLDSAPVTTTISSQSTPVKVEGATTARNPERFELTADNEFTYRGRSATEKEVVARLSISASNTNVAVYIAVNDVVLGNGAVVATQGANTPVAVTEAKRLDISEGDTISVYIENRGGTGDISVDRLSVIA